MNVPCAIASSQDMEKLKSHRIEPSSSIPFHLLVHILYEVPCWEREQYFSSQCIFFAFSESKENLQWSESFACGTSCLALRGRLRSGRSWDVVDHQWVMKFLGKWRHSIISGHQWNSCIMPAGCRCCGKHIALTTSARSCAFPLGNKMFQFIGMALC